jgi:hypothetical protein
LAAPDAAFWFYPSLHMKIALIGSRGIPARYSGFEQFYEQLAIRPLSALTVAAIFDPARTIRRVYKNISPKNTSAGRGLNRW